MSHFKIFYVIAGLSVFTLISTACSHAPAPKTQTIALDKKALTQLDAETLLNLFSFENVMELMEAVVEKDKNYNGPAHLHPLNKTMLQKTFLPQYYDTLDKLHSNEVPVVKAKFDVGKGHQTQSVKPLDLTNIFAFLSSSKKNPDEPINTQIWGTLTSRQIFAALDLPPVESYGVIITAPNIHSAGQIINSSQSSDTHLSLEAKDQLGIWAYTIDMPIGSDINEIKFTTPNTTETYRVEGMPTNAVQTIKINNKVIFTKPITTKISDKLRKRLG